MANRRFTAAAKELLLESGINFKEFFKDDEIARYDFISARKARGVNQADFRSLVEKINAMKLRRQLDDSLIILDPIDHSEPGQAPKRKPPPKIANAGTTPRPIEVDGQLPPPLLRRPKAIDLDQIINTPSSSERDLQPTSVDLAFANLKTELPEMLMSRLCKTVPLIDRVTIVRIRTGESPVAPSHGLYLFLEMSRADARALFRQLVAGKLEEFNILVMGSSIGHSYFSPMGLNALQYGDYGHYVRCGSAP